MRRLSAGRSSIRILARASYILQNTQTSTWAHSASYSVCTGTLSMLVKWPGCEIDYLPPSSVMVKNKWSYISSCSLCLHDMHGGYLYFVLFFMFTYPEITWICVCTQCTQVNIFLSFFVLIFLHIHHSWLSFSNGSLDCCEWNASSPAHASVQHMEKLLCNVYISHLFMSLTVIKSGGCGSSSWLVACRYCSH